MSFYTELFLIIAWARELSNKEQKNWMLAVLRDRPQLDNCFQRTKKSIVLGERELLARQIFVLGEPKAYCSLRTKINSTPDLRSQTTTSALFSENESWRLSQFSFSENEIRSVFWEQKLTTRLIFVLREQDLPCSPRTKVHAAADFRSRRTRSALFSENENQLCH